jgi:hypothetical protein
LHWYDLIGCIPLNAFRFVRIFRLFSILLRLHKLKIINIRQLYMYRIMRIYYNVLVEEISDRVVIKIIDGVQDEIRGGGPVVEDIIENVLKPKQDIISTWLSHRLKTAAAVNYAHHRDDIKAYIDAAIAGAIRKDGKIEAIEQVPFMGKVISGTIQSSISDIVYHIIDSAMHDLASDRNKVLVNEVTNIVFDAIEQKEQDVQLQEIAIDTFIRTLDIIKAQVGVKKWKTRYDTTIPDAAKRDS